MDSGSKLPHDAYQQMMNAAITKYSGEKSMQDPKALDALIKPSDNKKPQ